MELWLILIGGLEYNWLNCSVFGIFVGLDVIMFRVLVFVVLLCVRFSVCWLMLIVYIFVLG